MGSIGTERPKGMTDKAFLEDLYRTMEILATARKGGVIYAAATRRDGEGYEYPGQVYALVMPYSTSRGEFIVKEQDESMGPYDAEAPAKILDLLTETKIKYALEWREKCRKNLVAEALAKERARQVVAGTVIKLASPFYFGKSYGHYDTFRYTGKGSVFVALRDGVPSLSVTLGQKWKRVPYEVVA